MAEKYGTEHHEEMVAFGGFPDSIRKILRCFDEPFAGVVSSYFLSQLIAQHVKVAISGDGADELFGSYRTHRLAAERGLVLTARGARSLSCSVRTPSATLFAPDVAAALEGVSTAALFEETFARLTAGDPLNRVLEAEFRNVFPDQVLTYGDRLSMAHSLEVRSPYLDTDLVEFVARSAGPDEDSRRRNEVPAQAGGPAVLSCGDGRSAEGRFPDAGHAVVPARPGELRSRHAGPGQTVAASACSGRSKWTRSSIASISLAATITTSIASWRW